MNTFVAAAAIVMSISTGAMAGSASVIGGIPAQPAATCGAIHHVSDRADDQGCCGLARLCPRPLAMTVIRAPKHIQRT